MPVYTYRREDGTTFDYRQKFLDDPLTVDPETGQRVVRVVQPAGVIFKGSGFYVNDSKSGSRSTLTTPPKSGEESKPAESTGESKVTETKAAAEPAPAKAVESKPAPKAAAAD
ncbi:MAG: zinc ribbon domain-containing protein [Anaerolinea sp.]|nr:zinc ribbon domain-containing protein [Anaerolinea sp.]